MNHKLSAQVSALGLAAVVTLTLLTSINQLATSPAPAELMARTDNTPVQVVVVTGKRVAQS